MKMTLVLDTEDLDGLEDAYRIASMLRKKHAKTFAAQKTAFSKIALIKFLREFGKECEGHVAKHREVSPGTDPCLSGLRITHRFVDDRWADLRARCRGDGVNDQ